MVSGQGEDDGLLSSDPVIVRQWLERHHRKQLALLDKFLLELRLGRIGSSKASSGEDDDETMVDTNSENPASAASTSVAPVDRRLVVLQTVALLKSLMGPTGWRSAAELLHLVRAVGSELHTAGGMRREPAIGNIIRRIMSAIREEAQRDATTNGNDTTTLKAEAGNRLSLDSILWALPQHVRETGNSSRSSARMGDHERQESFLFSENAKEQEFPPNFYTARPDLRQTVMEAVQEIASDLEDTYKNLNEQTTSHIQPGDIVLTCGRSKTTELFLKAAAAKTKQRPQGGFQVIVCQGGAGSDDGGRAMARNLAQAGIETITIPGKCPTLLFLDSVLYTLTLIYPVMYFRFGHFRSHVSCQQGDYPSTRSLGQRGAHSQQWM